MATAWTPDLAVGDNTIDEQHQELFRRVDELLVAMQDGRAKRELRGLVAFLEGYVQEHFGAEERAMLATGYRGYELHKAEHEAFIATLAELKTTLSQRGPSYLLVVRVHDAVVGWLREHIMRSDKAIGAHLSARKAHFLKPLHVEGDPAPHAAPAKHRFADPLRAHLTRR